MLNYFNFLSLFGELIYPTSCWCEPHCATWVCKDWYTGSWCRITTEIINLQETADTLEIGIIYIPWLPALKCIITVCFDRETPQALRLLNAPRTHTHHKERCDTEKHSFSAEKPHLLSALNTLSLAFHYSLIGLELCRTQQRQRPGRTTLKLLTHGCMLTAIRQEVLPDWILVILLELQALSHSHTRAAWRPDRGSMQPV